MLHDFLNCLFARAFTMCSRLCRFPISRAPRCSKVIHHAAIMRRAAAADGTRVDEVLTFQVRSNCSTPPAACTEYEEEKSIASPCHNNRSRARTGNIGGMDAAYISHGTDNNHHVIICRRRRRRKEIKANIFDYFFSFFSHVSPNEFLVSINLGIIIFPSPLLGSLHC